MTLERPQPPEHLREPGFEIEPAPEVADWLKRTFILEGGLHVNPHHEHLVKVDLVAVWTNVEYADGGLPVAAAAEIINVNGKPWARAEKIDHLCMMHGNVPQARVWVYAPAWALADYWTCCARGEHELYHFAHRLSKEKVPMFDDYQRPVLTKREHDVGEFVGVMERYGPGACAGRSVEFVAAALKAPTVAPARGAFACGTCGGRV